MDPDLTLEQVDVDGAIRETAHEVTEALDSGDTRLSGWPGERGSSSPASLSATSSSCPQQPSSCSASTTRSSTSRSEPRTTTGSSLRPCLPVGSSSRFRSASSP